MNESDTGPCHGHTSAEHRVTDQSKSSYPKKCNNTPFFPNIIITMGMYAGIRWNKSAAACVAPSVLNIMSQEVGCGPLPGLSAFNLKILST